jgi:hypothetical protein
MAHSAYGIMGGTIPFIDGESGGGTVRKHTHGVQVAQVPMRAMLAMGVFIASISTSLLFTHSAHALPLGVDNLINKTVQPVVQLLPIGNNQPPQSSSPPPSQQNSPTTNNTSSQSSSPHSSAQTTTTNENATPSLVEASGDASLEMLPAIDLGDMPRSIMPFIYLASTQNGTSQGEVLGRATTNSAAVPIQASEEGWRLFGVAWYWWLVAIGAVFYCVRYFFLFNRAKPVHSSAGQ